MQFSDTTNKNGLIQECEFWCNLGDAGISGDATQLKRFANRINRAYDAVLPLLFSVGDKMRWDDTNHTDLPIGTVDLVSGQNDYQILVDDNGLSILNITDVRLLPSATATEYETLSRITLDDPRALRAMSPNPADTGIPSAFLEKDNTVFLDVLPTYSATAGMKIYFERIPDYFTSADTTQTPGIPTHFHQLLALYASLDWLQVFKTQERGLINDVKEKISQQRRDLERSIQLRNPIRRRVVPVTRRAR